MTAQVFKMRDFASRSIKEMIDEIHKQFATALDAGKKSDRARINAGQLLITLRKRIEAGEAGENVNWWKWYEDHFARSRRDANKCMKLANAEDPEAAHDEEKDKAKRGMAKARANVSPDEDEDLITHALRLVEEMDAKQRQRFFAEIRSLYADTFEDN